MLNNMWVSREKLVDLKCNQCNQSDYNFPFRGLEFSLPFFQELCSLCLVITSSKVEVVRVESVLSYL